MSKDEQDAKPRFIGEATDFVAVGELGKVQTGGTPSSKHPEYFLGDIPWVSTTSLNGSIVDKSCATKLITEDAVSNSATKIVPPGSILVGIRVGVGKVGINSVPMCTSQDVVSIIGIDEREWSKEYISFALHYLAPTLAAKAQGATISGISSATLKLAKIPKRKKAEQLLIVQQLVSVKKHINLAHEQIKRMETLVKSQFIEMFGNPAKIDRASKVKLGEVFRVRSSKRIYAKDQVKEGVPFYRLADIGSLIDGTIPDPNSFLSEARYQELKQNGQVPEPGDILVTARGTLGKCYIVEKGDRFYFQDGMISWLSRTGNSPLSEWIVALFDNDDFIGKLKESCSGTTVKYLSIADLADIEVVLPPLSLQREFAAFACEVDKLEFAARESIKKLQTLYDSLAQEYFG